MKSLEASLNLFPFAADAEEAAAAEETLAVTSGDLKITAREVNFFYGENQALFDNNLEIATNRVTAIIGPSGCGKSTHIRIYNRIYELYGDQRAAGEVLLDGENILDPAYDVMELRRKVGMIFQKPTPFPMSIFDNVAYGLKMHYRLGRGEMADRVEEALSRAALWDEVKDVLKQPGTALSGGQQQRLCIARALAVRAGGPADGRADLRHRPHRHRQDRRIDQRAERHLHHRHRHSQHAAGGPGFRFHRLLLSGAHRRVRRHPEDLYHPRQ